MRIKNWGSYVHFKDRQPVWIKLHRDLLDSMEWHSLDPAAAKALISILLVASEDGGVLPNTNVLAFRLRMSEQEVVSILPKLSAWLDNQPTTQDKKPEQKAVKKRSEVDVAEQYTLIKAFDDFWKAYPKNGASKKKSMETWMRHVKLENLPEIANAIQAYRDYLARTPWLEPRHATTWISQACWETDYASIESKGSAYAAATSEQSKADQVARINEERRQKLVTMQEVDYADITTIN